MLQQDWRIDIFILFWFCHDNSRRYEWHCSDATIRIITAPKYPVVEVENIGQNLKEQIQMMNT